MGHKAEDEEEAAAAAAVGCKVLPICDVATVGNAGGRKPVLEKEAHKRRKAVSRIKELLKSSKAGIKGWKVFYLIKNKIAALKDDDARSSNSSRTSFRWDVGSCSASSSSVFSPISMPLPSRSDRMWTNNLSATLRTVNSDTSSLGSPARTECSRPAQWIATDSDFVVLEL